ncbi:MAG: hypothetical protein SH868_04905 [Bythopirellula sp.]|nr:hypothetical protein [Bythopirellula sp.]
MSRTPMLALNALVVMVSVVSQAAGNVLLNPGFETDAVLNQEPQAFATDWDQLFNNAVSVSSPDIVRTGIGSLKLEGGGGFGVPGAFQSKPASPGEEWDLQGYMLTPAMLPADITFGTLKIVFSDGAVDLPPASVSIGQDAGLDFPGIESLPRLNSTSPVNEWQFTQARGVAPAGTVQVKFFALFVDQSAGTAYFDDLQAMLVEAGTPGDFDGDGDVDGRDFLAWQRGESPTAFSAADLATWQGAYNGGALAALNAVPEPTSAWLVVLGSLLCWQARPKHTEC